MRSFPSTSCFIFVLEEESKLASIAENNNSIAETLYDKFNHIKEKMITIK